MSGTVGRHLAKRLLQVPPLLLAVSALIFFGLRAGPFDPTVVAAESARDPEVIERLHREFGLDRPLHEQYVTYVTGAVRGDFGRSFLSNRSVAASIADRFPATLELALAGMLVGTVLGVTLGVVSAVYSGRWLDTAARMVTLAGISLPTFWLGIVAVAIFAVGLGWLPAGGRYPAHASFVPITGFIMVDSVLRGDPGMALTALRHLAMPAVVLGLFIGSFIGRITRASVLEQLGQPYVRTVRAKGVRRGRAIVGHALRNALLPIVTIIGLQFGNVLGGAVVVETVFSWPGLGKFIVDAIHVRDFPQIQAGILLMAVIYVFVNLAVDTTYRFLDPRVRL